MDFKNIKDSKSLFNYARSKYEGSSAAKLNAKLLKDNKEHKKVRSMQIFDHAYGAVQKLEKTNPEKTDKYRSMLRYVRRVVDLNEKDAFVKGDK